MAVAEKETLGFQAEVKQLLQLMIHSLYSNKEIFLRELISNASDAADKLRFEAINNDSLYGNDHELKIKVLFDKAARTVTISDNGIGMSRDEVISHLGTIAKSGTKEFFSKLSGDQQADAALIGQFGVGFYSAFIVADRVTVETRRAGAAAADGVRWESAGEGDYTVEQVEKTSRGTDIILHLREGEDELLSSWKLKSIIRKYSDHISLPIVMKKEEWDEEKKETVVRDEFETVNQASALWARSKSDITPEQYEEFYKHISHDFQPPLAYTHNRVEGRSEYTQLLYVPGHAPFDLWDRNKRGGIKLYVKRVFIMDDAEQLMPVYLRFVKGVIDSNDLPLNVSREILQESRDVRVIREGSTKRVLGMLEEMANSEEQEGKDKYATFWKEFGQVLKEGIGEDATNKDRIAKLLRFASTHVESAEQTVSFADYIGRMKEGQDKIYYPAPGNLPQEGRRSPAADGPRGRVDAVVPERLRRQGTGVRRQGRPGPGQARGRSGEEGTRRDRDAVQGPRREDEGRVGGQGQGRARHVPPDGFAGLPRGGRARTVREPRAHAEGGRPERTGDEADPRDQPEPPARHAPEVRGRRQPALRRLGAHPVRSGDAGRRGQPDGSGGVREAPERDAVGDGGQVTVAVEAGRRPAFWVS
ncbi:hypothetical protein Lal_00014818 [Lupinus albus]|nr:hypothetical protein Lal_00014818 [Lupinus albus]